MALPKVMLRKGDIVTIDKKFTDVGGKIPWAGLDGTVLKHCPYGYIVKVGEDTVLFLWDEVTLKEGGSSDGNQNDKVPSELPIEERVCVQPPQEGEGGTQG